MKKLTEVHELENGQTIWSTEDGITILLEADRGNIELSRQDLLYMLTAIEFA